MPPFFCLGLAAFLRGRKQPAYFLLSAAGFATCLYTYSSARVFVPLFLAALVYFYRKELLPLRKWHLLSSALFGVVFCALLTYWISPEGMARARELVKPDPAGIAYNYITYFDPVFLFLKRTNHPFYGPPRLGALQPLEFITVLAGLFLLWRSRGETTSRLLLFWLVMYPIPAALAAQGDLVKGIIGAPLFAIISAHGLHGLAGLFPRLSPRWCTAALGLGLATSNIYVAKRFFVDYPQFSTPYWAYGLREAIQRADQSGFPAILVSDRFFIPHISILFFTKYDPVEYQKAPLRSISQGKWSYTGFHFGKYHIVGMKEGPSIEGSALLMLPPGEAANLRKAGFPLREFHTVRHPDRTPAIQLFETTGPKLPGGEHASAVSVSNHHSARDE